MPEAAQPEYVIGLDLGDGESAIAYAAIDRLDQPDVYTDAATGSRSMVTAIARASTSRWVVGQQALLEYEPTSLNINFKSEPKDDHSWRSNQHDVDIFVTGFFGEFKNAFEHIAARGHVVVGHPAGWHEDSIDRYRQTFERANLSNVIMAPEPLAAFIQIRDFRNVSPEKLRNVLVVDVGSSTTDFTHVREMNSTPLALGGSLGAAQIDRLLLKLALENCFTTSRDESIVSGPTERNCLQYLCRLAKEGYFAGSSARFPDFEVPRFRAIAERAWDYLIGIDVEDLLHQPVGGWDRGWAGEFEDELIKARELLGTAKYPNTVVVTGGGSRMKFISSLCEEIFDRSVLESDSDPSLSVAKGLAGYGRWYYKVKSFRKEVDVLVHGLAIEPVIRAELPSVGAKLRHALVENLDIQIDLLEELERGSVGPEDFNSEGWKRFVTLVNKDGTELNKQVLGELRQKIENHVNTQSKPISEKFLGDPDALQVPVELPHIVFYRPRPGFWSAVNTLDEAEARQVRKLYRSSPFVRRMTKAGLKLSGPLLKLSARVGPIGLVIDEDLVDQVIRDVTLEIGHQLEARARKVEIFLGRSRT